MKLQKWIGIFLIFGLNSTQGFAEPLTGGRYIVLGSDSVSLEQAILQENGEIVGRLKYHRAFVAHLSEGATKKIKSQFGDKVLIEEDYEVTLNDRMVLGKPSGGSPQPAQTVPWGITAVKAPEAHALNRGAGAIVCVVDTGIQASHPDLAANILGGENFVSSRGAIDPTRWNDDNGHGTHVAGTIAALDNTIGVVGVAPHAKLFATKVLNKQGSGYSSAVADGVRSCVRNGAHVISMSLGSSSNSTVLHSAIIDARAAGAIIVVAAGNESGAVSYPAKHPESLAVSAVDSSLKFAYFSNFGPEVDFAAPGVGVLSTHMGSSYATFNGTSMAAPHVAGVAALMVSSKSLGIVADSIGLSIEQQGAGLVNALKTVQYK